MQRVDEGIQPRLRHLAHAAFDLAALAVDGVERARQQPFHVVAVGKAGQFVMAGHMGHALFYAPPLGDVARELGEADQPIFHGGAIEVDAQRHLEPQ